MPQLEQFVNNKSFNLTGGILVGTLVLTPPSYSGYPATGQFRLVFADNHEIVLITDASIHPWPILRAQEGTTAAAHALGVVVAMQLTAGGLQNLVGAQQTGTLEATGQVINFTGGATVTQASPGVIQVAVGSAVAPIEFVIDGGGVAITTGSKGYLEIPYACTITAVRLMADQSGSIDVSIKKANYATMPTTTSIVAADHPVLSSAVKSQDTTLTGWTTAIAAGDWLEYVVNSASVVTRVTLSLTVTRV